MKIRFVFVAKLFEFEFILKIPILREIVSYNGYGSMVPEKSQIYPRKISDLSQKNLRLLVPEFQVSRLQYS